ncbi:MAG: hypothetical protein HC930_08705 [Hydrococcus sp. SU_1_0]|nr:hypothetical protein [Hydrococcus sp. SU_1_0]
MIDRAYVVQETQPDGYKSVTNDNLIVTIAGKDSTGNNFLDEVPHKIAGMVYNDTNAPGSNAIDSTDEAIAGVEVKLYDNQGKLVGTTQTDTHGSYEFADLGDGSYLVQETQPNGYRSVTDQDGDNPNEIFVTLAGKDSLGNNFLEEVPHKIAGMIYDDTNAPGSNALDPTDAPIADVKVELFAADASGNAVGNAIATKMTGADGSYEFTGLGDASYVVKETQPNGYNSVADKDGGNLNEIQVTIAGEDSLGNNFLEEVTPVVLHKISGMVYNDTNAPELNAIDSTDAPIKDVKVELYNAAGELVGTTMTGADGSYEFAELADGTYVIKETQPAGYRSVRDKDGGNLNEIQVTIAGEDSLDNNFLEEVTPTRPPNGPAEGEKTKVYEFFNPSGRSSFYTVDENEKNHIAANTNSDNYETREGQAFRTLGENEFDPISGAESEEVYRFFNTKTGSHLYTTDENERDYITSNLEHFSHDKSKFYAYETEVEGSVDVHRFYNPIEDLHVFTHSDTEIVDLMAEDSGFNDEGVAFYLMPETMS